MSAATMPRTVKRWRMEGGELRYVGTRPAPPPRAVAVQQDARVDPLAQLRREGDDEQRGEAAS